MFGAGYFGAGFYGGAYWSHGTGAVVPETFDSVQPEWYMTAIAPASYALTVVSTRSYSLAWSATAPLRLDPVGVQPVRLVTDVGGRAT